MTDTIPVGDPCNLGSGADWWDGTETFLVPDYEITVNGKITSWCTYSLFNQPQGGSTKIKVFRIVGSTIVFIGESPYKATVSGINSDLPADISVKAGDILGFYCTTHYGLTRENTTHAFQVHGGDVTTDTPLAEWSDSGFSAKWRLQAQIEEILEVLSTKKTILGNTPKLGYTKKGAFVNKASGKGASLT